MTIYIYARCSTNETTQDISRQINQLTKDYTVEERHIYYEFASGAKENRKEFNNLLDVLKPGDTILTTEVSRLTRSTKQLCEVLDLIQEKKIRLIIGTFVVDCTNGELDAMTLGMIKMWGVFSEMEREMTRSRIKSGMENAKIKGKAVGRKKITYDDLPSNFIRYYPWTKLPTSDERKLTFKDLCALCSITRPTGYKYADIYEIAQLTVND